MKKYLLAAACVLMGTSVMAAPMECAYTVLQMKVQTARSQEEIQALMNKNVIFDDRDTRCGGSLMQLAIRRGNPGVLAAILGQDDSRANNMEKLDAFPIPGVQGEIPVLLFAGYYAPNEDMVKLLVNAGADITATDSNGRSLLWYMQFNPVLKNTALYDELNEHILISLTNQNAQQDAAAQKGNQGAATQNAGNQQGNQPRRSGNSGRLVDDG